MPSYSFKRITTYTPNELTQAIAAAVAHTAATGLDFYILLNGIDAYFEQRKRKEQQQGSTTPPSVPSSLTPPPGASS